jgi:L-asparaginase / beta-aspartyl-peptidase
MNTGDSPFTIAIHGGFGETLYTAETRKHRKDCVRTVLEETRTQLATGALAIDVVALAISKLENSGFFNAGKGSVANVTGEVTLDASIMDGRDKSFGAIANFKTVKNPIFGAHAALKAGNRFLVGPDAENFSLELEHVPTNYFVRLESKPTSSGTVGAIALDRFGNLAAGTSTGGYTNKPLGRVGDSPIIGAATFAENGFCAISTTGEGEFFIRVSAAHEIYAQIKYAGKNILSAAQDVIDNQVGPLGGKGGLIALDARGQVAWPFRTSDFGLLRGLARQNEITIGVFDDVESTRM